MLEEGYLDGLDAKPLDEVRTMHEECLEVETEVSYVRRLAQARIDIVRAELDRRSAGGSVGDLVAMLNKNTTAEEINSAFQAEAEGALKGILAYTTEELVSIDFKGNANSSIIDAAYTKVMDGNFAKVLSWYDNEWGYSSRCVDLIRLLAKRGL